MRCVVMMRLGLSGFNLIDGPAGVLGDEGFVVAGGASQSGERRGVGGIAGRGADIAEEAAALGAQHRRVGEASLKTGVVEGKQFDQAGLGEVGARVWSHEPAFARESVPGTDREAIVAAEDAAPEGAPEFDGDAAIETDGQVGTATTADA